jgi:hypothetical protein
MLQQLQGLLSTKPVCSLAAASLAASEIAVENDEVGYGTGS